ncbi:ABC transporter substrate-binding protein [Pseudogracilibacillus auburnensis]|uniref:ABC transporter substrate-binding protein n=1 Tax=Pseudogracilibacillus auburnensis TaxID=1494959 RepID=UPI001A963430|nr:extracellular solute-binding protein [Pseudogracilibacillus auburnensis]MBO1005138.1 extracellular solute-binding protein [Pseudogracilibacillus auburnensis]
MKKRLSVFMFLLMFILVLAGCKSGGNLTSDAPDTGSSNDGNGGKDTEEVEEAEEPEGTQLVFDTSTSGEVTFWTFTADVYEDIVKEFNKVYPDIKVQVVGMDFGEMHDKLQTTMAAGSGAPDVAQVEQGQFARYGTEGLLEDLLQAPYDAGRYQDMVSEYNWERWKSVDGTKLLGMPWDVTPGVFYYRADLYEQMGLPSDPDELGDFLQDPDNVLTAAQTFAANGIYMYEWRDSPAIQYGDAIGYFDSDYNWVRNDDKMAELLDFVKRGNQLGWAPQMSVLFDEEGVQLVNQGKVASFPVGNWAARELKNKFPEQEGKWRVTKMPLGLNVGLGGSTFIMPAQGENKEASWAFVEWMNQAEEAWKVFTEFSIQPAWKHITAMPWYQEHTNDYLGGQQDYKLYDMIDDNIPVRRLTPLDGQAWDIYISQVAESIDNNIDSKTTLQQIEDTIEKQLGPEIEKLKAEQAN